MVVVLFGVSGAGKTTLGQILAGRLGWKFDEADDFHSQKNIDKMRAGLPLTDEDRKLWLENLRDLIERRLAAKEDAILACSALKRGYRQYLRVSEQVRFVYLRGSPELIANQLRWRHGHFMNPDLLESQFKTLEEPDPAEQAITIDLGDSVEDLAERLVGMLKRLRC